MGITGHAERMKRHRQNSEPETFVVPRIPSISGREKSNVRYVQDMGELFLVKDDADVR